MADATDRHGFFRLGEEIVTSARMSVATACLLLLGCSGDHAPKVADGGPDAQEAGESSSPDESPWLDAGLPDEGSTSDYLPQSCDPSCQENDRHLCRLLADQECTDCLVDADCLINPWATGAHCIDDIGVGLCVCATGGECQVNRNGPVCDPDRHVCRCTSDADCAGGLLCMPGDVPGVMTCSPPCSSNADCHYGYPQCDPRTHKCAQCLLNADCPSTAPLCDSTLGACVGCLNWTDCASSPAGTLCRAGACGCDNDEDCQGRYPRGNSCLTAQNLCGCTEDGNCTGNAHGPSCDLAFLTCGCASDQDCQTSPYVKCSLPYAGAKYLQCQTACASDAECVAVFGGPGTNWALPFCFEGRCVRCISNTDCTGIASLCNTSFGGCVMCLGDGQCPGSLRCHPLRGCVDCLGDTDCAPGMLDGNACNQVNSDCVCFNDADCVGNIGGPSCYAPNKICSCTGDADCNHPPYTQCEKPYAWASYQRCRSP